MAHKKLQTMEKFTVTCSPMLSKFVFEHNKSQMTSAQDADLFSCLYDS
jgi:hypothetical protein